ncbi:hypothetical protein [Anaerobaca lacustris]|uniref:HEAT repeat domain-containing protein n=1 Tax=Anaerobaca lacustris TaxID=3044600 RepID=A0AAW6TRW5_9BACT|nr:hypothetical protein [Sedimentisphaerales bacterium M17dextr]
MKLKRAVFVLLVCGLVLAVLGISKAALDARRIEDVMKKDALTQQDFQIIDQFIRDAVATLVRTIDFTEVSKTRALVVSHQSTQAQYAQQYSESCYRHIAEGMEHARADIRDETTLFKVVTNLLILIDSLKDPRLIELAIQEIPHGNSAVRYWAVRASTDPELWTKIGQGQGAAQLATRVMTACDQVVDSSGPEVLLQIARFAGRFDTGQATALLMRITEVRVRSYADWSVNYELMDGAVLRLLTDKIVGGGNGGSDQLARRFAHLYSFAIQRYIKGQNLGRLRDVSRNYLISVLIDTEDKCVGRLLGAPQATIRRAIEGGDLAGLQAEHDRLLGTAASAGVIPTRFNFSYGAQGENRTAPPVLPDPPQRTAPAAEDQP